MCVVWVRSCHISHIYHAYMNTCIRLEHVAYVVATICRIGLYICRCCTVLSSPHQIHAAHHFWLPGRIERIEDFRTRACKNLSRFLALFHRIRHVFYDENLSMTSFNCLAIMWLKAFCFDRTINWSNEFFPSCWKCGTREIHKGKSISPSILNPLFGILFNHRAIRTLTKYNNNEYICIGLYSPGIIENRMKHNFSLSYARSDDINPLEI